MSGLPVASASESDNQGYCAVVGGEGWSVSLTAQELKDFVMVGRQGGQGVGGAGRLARHPRRGVGGGGGGHGAEKNFL